ncbi:serine hydrolase domain-containing protein [Flavihumibacter solisilvae]|uniref:serine hydrolase domain-containing protein n=1 Tax=Flavihumibacter solisilvae TaxID=1349421 RepID=UPI000AE548B6|nr:serine hydrolase domain-containing protein [Flavihumibacter solisilvae]
MIATFTGRIATILLGLASLPSTVKSQDLTQIDSLLRQYSGPATPGASLLVIKDGKKLLQRTYGSADIENHVAVKATHNFRLASVTKQFTATCILQLVGKKKISLATSLTDIFPGFPAYGEKVTIKHLLTHTSGLVDYENFVAGSAMNPQVMDRGVLEIIMKQDSLYFEPGTRYQYSNTAYALLALIVEKYSGESFPSYLRKHVFDPLGMYNSVAYVNGINEIPGRAWGYSKNESGWIRKDQSSTSAVLGDGGIYSSTEDLYKWDQSLYSGKLLPKSTWQEAFRYNTLANGDTVHYGYGWHLRKNNNNEQVIYHTGSTTSFRNIIYRVPSRRLTLILLTNRNTPEEENMVDLAESLLSVLRLFDF